MFLVQRAQAHRSIVCVKHADSDELAIQLCSMESHKGLRLTDLIDIDLEYDWPGNVTKL